MAIIKKYSPRMYFLILALAVSVRNAKPAFAADAEPVTFPEVVVTGQQHKKSYKAEKVSSTKYLGPLVDIPQTVTIIPQAVMEDQGATTLREVLRNTPGISMQAGEGGVPAGDNLTIRGFSARTDIFVDNVRDFGGYARDAFNVQQVEVVKGPASSYAGRGSTGGSVNLVSKAPTLEAHNDATAGWGTEQYQRYTFDINQPLTGMGVDNAAFLINAMYHTNHVSERDVTMDERWGFAPAVAFGIDTPTRLTLSYYYMGQDNIPDYGLPWVPTANATGPLAGFAEQPPPVDRSNYYGLIDRDYEDIATHMATAVIEHDLSEELSLRNIFRYGITDRDSIITPPRFVTGSNSMISRSDVKSRDQVDEIYANQTDITFAFETGALKHDAVAGVDLAYEEEANYGRRLTDGGPATDLFDPDPYQPVTGSLYRNGAKGQAESRSMALYGFDKIGLNEQWELNGGLRWDYFEVEAVPLSGNIATATGQTEGEVLQRIDRELSYRAGIVYKPRPEGSIYAAYGTSFNPSAEGLTLGTGATALNSITLDPEKSETYEAGTKWELLDKHLSLMAAVFQTEKTNARTQDPADATDVVVLNGEQRVRGIELGATGEIMERWSVFAGYTYLDSEIIRSADPLEIGKDVNNTPENTFNLWTMYELPWKIDVGFGAQFIDERFNNNTNTRMAPDFWLLDAMVAYHVDERVTLRLNVYNLTDEEYIDRMSGGHFIPGAGRSAIVTTSFEF